jgi:hypothetical protein
MFLGHYEKFVILPGLKDESIKPHKEIRLKLTIRPGEIMAPLG